MRHDLKMDLAGIYRPGTKDFDEVIVPPLRYLAVDGSGDPNTSERYAVALECLYTAAYSVRAALKARTGDDFVVGPLEGLWSASNPEAFVSRDKDAWDWTMLIPLPDAVSAEDEAAGLEAAARKKPQLPLADVRVLALQEGRCLQILHVGPYDNEGPTLQRLHHELMPALGLTFNGPHHEIYLSDARRTDPAKLRTILRQPVAPIA